MMCGRLDEDNYQSVIREYEGELDKLHKIYLVTVLLMQDHLGNGMLKDFANQESFSSMDNKIFKIIRECGLVS